MADKSPKVGTRVQIVGREVKGKIAFVGSTKFSVGKWFGVILDEPKGKHNGCVQGNTYFTCPDNHGIFVRRTQLLVLDDENDYKSTESVSASTGSSENIYFSKETEKRRKSCVSTGIPKLSTDKGTNAGAAIDAENTGCVKRKTYFTHPDNQGILKRQTQILVPDDESYSKRRATMSSTSSLMNFSFSKVTKKHRKSSAGTGIPKLSTEKGSKNAANVAEAPSRASSASFKKYSTTEENASRLSAVDLNSKDSVSTFEFKGLLQKDQEIENLRNEIKDLNEKLETLKVKREEDQFKIKEAEKTKIQIQQLREYKTKITEVQADLQRQLTLAKKEAKEAIEAKEQHAKEMSDLAETMEMAILDKEMAEEKCETLQAELEQTKEKLEELQIDHEIMTEMDNRKIDGTATMFQFKQLELQNERLKEALVRMRDLSAQEKQDQQRMQKEFDQQKSEIVELSGAKEKLSLLVDDYEKQIGELKEQVDDALGSEKVIEILTEKNLALEDRVRELQVLVDDLEHLLDVNDQLQETAKETELELREELDMSNAKIKEGKRKLEAMQEAIANYEQTIQKFRDQTEHLRETNYELKMQLQKESNRVAMSKPMEFLDFTAKYADTKAFALAIEMDLRRLEIEEANHHVNYLCAFMPDHFLNRGSDHDAILLLLFVPRMITKAEILASQVKKKFPTPENISRDIVFKTHKINRYSFANRLMYQLYLLQSLLHQYASALSNCSVELFMKIGSLYMEMAVQEKPLDFYIDLLRKDQLDENVNLDSLIKSVMYFYNLYKVHLASEKVDCSVLMGDHIKLIGAACESIHTDICSVKVLLDNDGQNSRFGSLLKGVCTYTDDVRQFVKKIRHRLPADNSSTVLQFHTEVQEILNQCRENIGQVMSAAFHLRRAAVQQMATSGHTAHVNIEKLKELSHVSTDKASDKDDSGPECMRQLMYLVVTCMKKISSAIQGGEYEVKRNVEKGNPPVYKRAQAIKEESRNLENLKFKLEFREGDICKLKKMLKIKNDELSEMHVRKEITEKKLEMATKARDERIDRIQRQLDETKMLLKKKEKMFEETLDHLQADIDALETERGELKEKIKLVSKTAVLEGFSNTTSVTNLVASPTSSTISGSSPSNFVHSRDSSFLSEQIQDLQFAIKHLRNENSRLKADRMAKQLESLPPLKIPSKPTGLLSATGFKNMIDFEESDTPGFDNFIALSKKSKDLLQKAHKLTLPVVVDITRRKPGTDPVIEKMDAKSQLVDSAIKFKTLQDEAQKLSIEFANFRASQKQGTQINADFSSFPIPKFTKVCNQEKELIARVTFPNRCSADEKAIVPLMVSMDELNQLHTKMLS